MGRHSCSTKQKLRKGLWSPEEDEKLFNYITRFGVGCWSSVPKVAGLQRCGKSCRLRWINYLRPDLKRGMFSQQEEDLIINLHKVLGNRWAQIAAQLPGRTDNEIKNLWNSSLKKKLMKQGIDPTTHQPIKDKTPDFTQARKNDTVSHQAANGLQLPPPPIMSVKSEQPIFFMDDSTLTNNDLLPPHYAAGHFQLKPPCNGSSSEFEPGVGPTGLNWALLATQDWQNQTRDLGTDEFSDPWNVIIPRVDSFSMYNTSNEAKESSSYSSISSKVNMGEMNSISTGGLSSWDGIPGNYAKLEGLFDHYDYDDEDEQCFKKEIIGVVNEFEDRKPDNPWLMERIGLDDHQFSGSLSNSNFENFQQL
ncbi:hypothetical protein V2J09_006815 [Rumex salicifolius]